MPTFCCHVCGGPHSSTEHDKQRYKLLSDNDGHYYLVPDEATDWDRLDATTGLPKIVGLESCPEGTLYMISSRREILTERGYELEPWEDWAKRCAVILNIV